MKKIIIDNTTALQENVNAWDKEVTLYGFMSHMKAYIKELLSNPIFAKPDAYLSVNGLGNGAALKYLLDDGIIERAEKVVDDNGDKFSVTYRLPRKNFERKMKRLYSKLFESNIIDKNALNEDGEGGCCGDGGAVSGGATSADASGQYTQPFGGVQRRKIYVTQEQLDRLTEAVEIGTAFGDFGYDAPGLKRKKDPAYDHKNMMKKSIKGE